MTGRMAHGRRRSSRPLRAQRSRAGRFWRGFAKGFGEATGLTGPRIGHAVGTGLLRLLGRPLPSRPTRPARPARPRGRRVGPAQPLKPRPYRRPRLSDPLLGLPRRQAHRKRGLASIRRRKPSDLPTAKAGTPPAFSGPHVKVLATMPKAPIGGTRVSSTGLAGPGNRGAGPGMGAPAYGTGGAHGDDGHLISPGSAGGSATGGAPNTSGAPIGGDQRRPLDNWAEGGVPASWTEGAGRPMARINHTPRSGGTMTDGYDPNPGSAPPPAGGGGLPQATSGANLSHVLTEAPETDADYVAGLRVISDQLGQLGSAMEEYEAMIIEQVGVDQSATGRFGPAAEAMHSAAEHIAGAVQDFLSIYAGVIETAASGTSIPDGKGGRSRFWTGDVQ